MADHDDVNGSSPPLNLSEGNNMSNYHDYSEDSFSYDFCQYRSDSLSWYSICILILAIFGLVVNGCLLFVILRRQYLRNFTNILLVNLTVSDMILFVSTVPFLLEADLHPCWQFGTAMCKIMNAVWIVAHSVCMFTLAALAVERYCAVTSRAGFRSKTCALLSIWILAILLSLPSLITAHMPIEGVCIGHSLNSRFIKGYITSHVILTFILPLVTIAVCYIKMARALIKDNPKPSQKDKSSHSGFSKRRRIAAIVLVLVLMFAVFWTPFHLFNLMASYNGFSQMKWRAFYIFYIVHLVLIYVYLCLNPVVVFFMSPILRQELFSCSRHDSKGKLQKLEADESHSSVSEIDMELHLPINRESDEDLGDDV